MAEEKKKNEIVDRFFGVVRNELSLLEHLIGVATEEKLYLDAARIAEVSARLKLSVVQGSIQTGAMVARRRPGDVGSEREDNS